MQFLDALLDEERALRTAPGAPAALPDDEPAVSPGLLARVLVDAEAAQAGFAAAGPVARPAPVRAGIWAQLGAALGGWPALGGLAAASIAGLWLGFSPPQGLSDTAALYLGQDSALLDPVSGFDFDLEGS